MNEDDIEKQAAEEIEKIIKSGFVLSSPTPKFELFAVYAKCLGDIFERVTLAGKKCRIIIDYDPAKDGHTQVFVKEEGED